MREGNAAAGRAASSPGTHRFRLAWPKTVLVVLGCRIRHGTLPLGWVAMLAQPAWAPESS